MNADIIFSSQPSTNSSEISTAISSQNEDSDFCLELSDQESDWDFDITPESSLKIEPPKNLSKLMDVVSDCTNACNPESSENSLDFFSYRTEYNACIASEESSEMSTSFTQSQNEVNEMSDSQNMSSENEIDFACSSSILIKCKTAFSQNFDVETFAEMSASFAFTCSGGSLPCASKSNIDPSAIATVIDIMEANQHALETFTDLKPEKLNVINLIACVLNCYPVREIWCKSTHSWQTMAVVMLTDFNDKYYKLNLWSDRCRYALSLCSGDVIFINKLQLKSIYNEIFLGLTSNSQIIPFGTATDLTKPFSNYIDCEDIDLRISIENRISVNANWFTENHKLMCTSPIKNIVSLKNNEIQFRDIRSLNCAEVIHVFVKIASVQPRKTSNRNIATVVCVCNNDNMPTYRSLYLNGSTSGWVEKFKRLSQHTWELRNIACCASPISDRVELHTTIFSSAECLFPGDEKSFSFVQDCFKNCSQPISNFKSLALWMQTNNNTMATLSGLCVCSINYQTRKNNIKVSRHSTKSSKMKWLESIWQFKRSFKLNCQFKSNLMTPRFTVHVSNKIMKSILTARTLGDGCMDTNTNDSSIIDDILNYPQLMDVQIFSLQDENEMPCSNKIYLKSTVKIS